MNINTAPGILGLCSSAECVESHCDVRGNNLRVNQDFVALTGGVLPIAFSRDDRLKDVGAASNFSNLGRVDVDGDGDKETVYTIGGRAYAYLGD